jgi:hypothetical protein
VQPTVERAALDAAPAEPIAVDPAALPSDLVVLDLAAPAAPRAIDPSQYVCPATTPFDEWASARLLDWYDASPSNFNLLYDNLLADLVPTYDALNFLTTATPQSFGAAGEWTKILTKTERDVKRFWDIPSADIQVVAIHGRMLQDTARVAAVYRTVFRQSPARAQRFASLVRAGVLELPLLAGGDYPIFSLNAVATLRSTGEKKIAMGDGILALYRGIGLDDVAPQAIFTHEFSHQIQFARGYFGDPAATTGSGAERTRYTELMADAYAGYYLTHARGATMNRKRVEQFLATFYDVGDCAFTSSGHHGTPNQRLAAARFGFAVADEAQKQGHILTADAFHARWLAAYPAIVAPDAR